MCLHARSARAARTCRQRDETAPDEIFQWLLALKRRQPRDRSAAPGHHHLATALDTLKVLAEPIVKLAHPNLIRPSM